MGACVTRNDWRVMFALALYFKHIHLNSAPISGLHSSTAFAKLSANPCLQAIFQSPNPFHVLERVCVLVGFSRYCDTVLFQRRCGAAMLFVFLLVSPFNHVIGSNERMEHIYGRNSYSFCFFFVLVFCKKKLIKHSAQVLKYSKPTTVHTWFRLLQSKPSSSRA